MCENIHEELRNMEEIQCPFCNKQIAKRNPLKHKCCATPNIKNGEQITCLSCGQVHGYKPLIEFVYFHQSKHRFNRKSVYQRKYHIKNIANNIAINNNFQITFKNMEKIIQIFEEMGKVTKKINIDRHRMININFILKQLFKMMELPYEKVKVSRSKKTIASYQNYWDAIYALCNKQIQEIIHK